MCRIKFFFIENKKIFSNNKPKIDIIEDIISIFNSKNITTYSCTNCGRGNSEYCSKCFNSSNWIEIPKMPINVICEVTDYKGNHCPDKPHHRVLSNGKEFFLCKRCFQNYLNTLKSCTKKFS